MLGVEVKEHEQDIWFFIIRKDKHGVEFTETYFLGSDPLDTDIWDRIEDQYPDLEYLVINDEWISSGEITVRELVELNIYV